MINKLYKSYTYHAYQFHLINHSEMSKPHSLFVLHFEFKVDPFPYSELKYPSHTLGWTNKTPNVTEYRTRSVLLVQSII